MGMIPANPESETHDDPKTHRVPLYPRVSVLQKKV
jgi:hypothetical protein